MIAMDGKGRGKQLYALYFCMVARRAIRFNRHLVPVQPRVQVKVEDGIDLSNIRRILQ